MRQRVRTKHYILSVKIGEKLSYALLNEDPLTFVYSEKGENALQFSGKEYNHFESLRAKLVRNGIESYIVEIFEIIDDEKFKLLSKEEKKKVKWADVI